MNIQRAIKFLYPGVVYVFNGYEDYNYLIWPTNAGVKPTLDELTLADLPAAKNDRIARAKREAAVRIYDTYPAYAQTNAALGLYDTLPSSDPFQTDNMKEGIQAIIDAERAAEVAINILTTAAAVDSFTW